MSVLGRPPRQTDVPSRPASQLSLASASSRIAASASSNLGLKDSRHTHKLLAPLPNLFRATFEQAGRQTAGEVWLQQRIDEFNRGGKQRRKAILEEFLVFVQESDASGMMELFNHQSQLFFVRLTSWFNLTLPMLYELPLQLKVFMLFLEFHEQVFVRAFFESGVIIPLMHTLSVTFDVPDEVRTLAVMVLHKLAMNGRHFKELLCQRGLIPNVLECVCDGLRWDTLKCAGRLLSEVFRSNPKHQAEVLDAFQTLIAHQLPMTQRVGIQGLISLHVGERHSPLLHDAARHQIIVERALRLLSSQDLRVGADAYCLLCRLVRIFGCDALLHDFARAQLLAERDNSEEWLRLEFEAQSHFTEEVKEGQLPFGGRSAGLLYKRISEAVAHGGDTGDSSRNLSRTNVEFCAAFRSEAGHVLKWALLLFLVKRDNELCGELVAKGLTETLLICLLDVAHPVRQAAALAELHRLQLLSPRARAITERVLVKKELLRSMSLDQFMQAATHDDLQRARYHLRNISASDKSKAYSAKELGLKQKLIERDMADTLEMNDGSAVFLTGMHDDGGAHEAPVDRAKLLAQREAWRLHDSKGTSVELVGSKKLSAKRTTGDGAVVQSETPIPQINGTVSFDVVIGEIKATDSEGVEVGVTTAAPGELRNVQGGYAVQTTPSWVSSEAGHCWIDGADSERSSWKTRRPNNLIVGDRVRFCVLSTGAIEISVNGEQQVHWEADVPIDQPLYAVVGLRLQCIAVTLRLPDLPHLEGEAVPRSGAGMFDVKRVPLSPGSSGQSSARYRLELGAAEEVPFHGSLASMVMDPLELVHDEESPLIHELRSVERFAAIGPIGGASQRRGGGGAQRSLSLSKEPSHRSRDDVVRKASHRSETSHARELVLRMPGQVRTSKTQEDPVPETARGLAGTYPWHVEQVPGPHGSEGPQDVALGSRLPKTRTGGPQNVALDSNRFRGPQDLLLQQRWLADPKKAMDDNPDQAARVDLQKKRLAPRGVGSPRGRAGAHPWHAEQARSKSESRRPANKSQDPAPDRAAPHTARARSNSEVTSLSLRCTKPEDFHAHVVTSELDYYPPMGSIQEGKPGPRDISMMETSVGQELSMELPSSQWPQESTMTDDLGDPLAGGPSCCSHHGHSHGHHISRQMDSSESLINEALHGQVVQRSTTVAVVEVRRRYAEDEEPAADDSVKRILHVAPAPYHDCLAFDKGDAERDRQRANDNINRLLHPGTQKLFKDLNQAGGFPKRRLVGKTRLQRRHLAEPAVDAASYPSGSLTDRASVARDVAAAETPDIPIDDGDSEYSSGTATAPAHPMSRHFPASARAV